MEHFLLWSVRGEEKEKKELKKDKTTKNGNDKFFKIMKEIAEDYLTKKDSLSKKQKAKI